jgi:uncharacterized surface protein with fasciclin (FAS1) repeats
MNTKSSTGLILGVVGVIAAIGIITAVVANRDSGDSKKADSTQQSSVSSSDSSKNSSDMKKEAASDIVSLAVATPDLSTLVVAVKAADLVATLQSEGPFTVFAPTNAAFAALPAGTLDSLLLPENKATLARILTYHVVSGQVMSSELKDGQVVKTVQGETLTVTLADSKVMLTDTKGNKSTVAKADIEASNGVVHVIDSVVLPQ